MSNKKTQWLAMGPVNAYFGFCGSEKAYLKTMKKIGVSDPCDFVSSGAGATVHTISNGGTPTFLMCIDVEAARLNYTRNQIDALVCHEASHVAQWCVEEMNAKGERELFAYIAQYVFGFAAKTIWGDI